MTNLDNGIHSLNLRIPDAMWFELLQIYLGHNPEPGYGEERKGIRELIMRAVANYIQDVTHE